MMAVRFWTKDELQTLKTLWAEGKTAAEIAKVIGRPRNAIIGQAHRTGLEKRPSPIQRKKKRPEPVKIERTRAESYAGQGFNFKGRKKHHMTVKAEMRAAERVQINNEAYGPKKDMIDLEANECRWPVDDKFCAAKVDQGRPYCENHASIAYQTQRKEPEE